MKVILANPRGFCAGVNMAIECLEEVIRIFGSNVYVYHEIVHNKYVVNRFTEQGVTFVNTVSEVPENSILVFSAHGVSPVIRNEARERNIRTIDATCPLVTKVHTEAIKYADAGYHIILIGHEGHDEVIGTMGEAPESITLIETPEEVAALEFPEGARLAYLTQTTLSVEEASRVIRSLKEKYPEIESPPKEDICYATTNRQEAVSELVSRVDLVLVLGSQNSSNSKRLMEIGKTAGKPAYLVDGVEEVQPEWLQQAETVLITAGASAPEVVVEELIQFLETNYQAEIENAIVRKESVRFPLPRELRAIQ
ncbi:4-hydroxy-3-methylbut-2-enyl diphosphate reductase [Gimesia sp.]|uniref:4-hydroxy-3-methylbut-2-enyl diphosphate reductase n=1 Tax=Gimesia sp. TaxID=2024833 RepID=UPI000C6AA94B|nr:4-hydroxy-3-methylbut-2-enyl diphosphate reductase [Gimesia sp.]MAX38306.1 4-hydroxy-3-methylbut-2-enyl diphosphate reductase [Gimesia sp.]HBL45016.1 4-hydroxy-3-methylbut-2-enyl diphosphate reductase [Planctomycetaceae bacterium]|tara:strand:- start:10039 stop:10968 length:930 start_codon:yes stop_codon:yes gene_type:complete